MEHGRGTVMSIPASGDETERLNAPCGRRSRGSPDYRARSDARHLGQPGL